MKKRLKAKAKRTYVAITPKLRAKVVAELLMDLLEGEGPLDSFTGEVPCRSEDEDLLKATFALCDEFKQRALKDFVALLRARGKVIAREGIPKKGR